MMSAAAITDQPTLAEAMRRAREALSAAGVATPDLDARVLLGHALGLDRTAMIAESRRRLDAEAVVRTDALIERRIAGESVGRILGRREFWGMDFALGPETLEPRPDTETLVEAVLAFIDAGPGRNVALRIADLGTGTGCLLVALLKELPAASGIGVDISDAAVEVTRANAAANGLEGRAGFETGDWGKSLAGGFDVIVSNPPYIATADCARLDTEVARFDPVLALDGGSDGLDAYRAIAADARRLLRPDGCLALELGAGQRVAVTEIGVSQGLAPSSVRRDLAGIERALVMTVS